MIAGVLAGVGANGTAFIRGGNESPVQSNSETGTHVFAGSCGCDCRWRRHLAGSSCYFESLFDCYAVATWLRGGWNGSGGEPAAVPARDLYGYRVRFGHRDRRLATIYRFQHRRVCGGAQRTPVRSPSGFRGPSPGRHTHVRRLLVKATWHHRRAHRHATREMRQRWERAPARSGPGSVHVTTACTGAGPVSMPAARNPR